MPGKLILQGEPPKIAEVTDTEYSDGGGAGPIWIFTLTTKVISAQAETIWAYKGDGQANAKKFKLFQISKETVWYMYEITK